MVWYFYRHMNFVSDKKLLFNNRHGRTMAWLQVTTNDETRLIAMRQ